MAVTCTRFAWDAQSIAQTFVDCDCEMHRLCLRQAQTVVVICTDCNNVVHRNLEYLEGQLEAHRLAQRNKMEMADRYALHPPSKPNG